MSKFLDSYNETLRALTDTDIRIEVYYDGDEWIINHSSVELETGSHIHASNLNNGIKQLIETYLEHLIWKIEDVS